MKLYETQYIYMYFKAFHDFVFQLRVEAILARTISCMPKPILLTELSTGRYDMAAKRGSKVEISAVMPAGHGWQINS